MTCHVEVAELGLDPGAASVIKEAHLRIIPSPARAQKPGALPTLTVRDTDLL